MNYRFPRVPQKIVEAALETLGIEASISPKDDWSNISATDWFSLCHTLYLSPDCYRYGYSRREHMACIRAEWRKGELHLPRTPKLRGILNEIRQQERESRRWRDESYGFRLRWKARWQDFKSDMKHFANQTLKGAGNCTPTWSSVAPDAGGLGYDSLALRTEGV